MDEPVTREDLLALATPIPERLEGPRLELRVYDVEDAAAVRAAVDGSREHLQPWLPWAAGSHRHIEDSVLFCARSRANWLLRRDTNFGVWRKRDGTFLGGAGIQSIDWDGPRFELGYWLTTAAEGQGYMSEAVRLLTACLFDRLRALRVEIRCDAANDRSRRVAERNGYILEARFRTYGRATDGAVRDLLVLGLTRTDYEALRPSWEGASRAGPPP